MSRSVDPDHRASGWTVLRPWRKLLGANDIDGVIAVVRRYGWFPALCGLAVHSLARGAFEYVSEPFVVAEGYVFPAWPAALVVNLLFGAFVVVFSWFLYFGLIGVVAGTLSDDHVMETDVFKIGGYLLTLFAPVFFLATILMATVGAPDGLHTEGVSGNGAEAAEFAMTSYSFVYDTPQMHAVRTLKAIAWIVVGFLMLPVVGRLYEIDEKRSVLSVLPVTLAGVISAFLL
ncbi:hypothetical protein [Natrialba swarupiae]|uniref:Yip1 domain-containing protein n=1 Tax=Natrialba swarupiae TaxID=2448032 RepID=A0A5D5AR13_9EURY|nr:hypothetical protein [Natrialba swarupiae]TYT63355.1 hypothetical protein FYC77_04600 [Natrialba swarupiae]